MNKHLALARPEILILKPYEHAVWNPAFERMHANENPWRADGDNSLAGLNRYPECPPVELTKRLATIYGVAIDQVLVGRGSDEGIDLLCRTFCRAGIDSVIICPPTFGYYKVAAKVQGANVIEVPLKSNSFALDRDAVLNAWQPNVKLLFLCSPGNPTANLLDESDLEIICQRLDGKALVVIDEAYIEFAGRDSLTRWLPRFSNLVVLRTLSKAYALAGVRCGVVIADRDIIGLLERVIPPYAIPSAAIESVLALTDLKQRKQMRERVATIVAERELLLKKLAESSFVKRVWPSDSNFILVECVNTDAVVKTLASVHLVVRDQRNQPGLNNCLRISVGTPEQNTRLLQSFAQAAGVAA